MSLADELLSFLRCPGCSSQEWDLRGRGTDELPRLEGTLCCTNCGQGFAARGGVLDMVPGIVEGRVATLRRRLISPPVARLYEEKIRHFLTPLTTQLRSTDWPSWLANSAPPTPGQRIVDLGCGRGRDLTQMEQISQPNLAVGIDLSPVLLAEAARFARSQGRKNVVFVRADLEDLPLVAPDFAWAACYGVLHRLRRPHDTLRHLASLLCPGGTFTALTTLRLDSSWLGVGQSVMALGARVHLFSRQELTDMCREAGLNLTQLSPLGPVTLLAAHRQTS